MIGKHFRALVLSAFWVAMLTMAGGHPVMATKYLKTSQPLNRVGSLDPVLSVACQHLQFNQRKIQDLHIGFAGKQGRGITGVATKAFNLKDPKGLARDDTTYHFFNDGYSNCRVYTARFRLLR